MDNKAIDDLVAKAQHDKTAYGPALPQSAMLNMTLAQVELSGEILRTLKRIEQRMSAGAACSISFKLAEPLTDGGVLEGSDT